MNLAVSATMHFGGPGSGRHPSGRHPLETRNWKLPRFARKGLKDQSMDVVLLHKNQIRTFEKGAIDKKLVEKYAKAMKNGKQFPMILTYLAKNGKSVTVTDGHHRFVAWTDRLGNKKIPVIVQG